VSGRSHPPSLVRHAERLIRDEHLFGRGDVVLCACSGGPDSSALLHVLALLRPRLGHQLVAHGVDHGLRAAAAAELEAARAVAEPLGVPFAVTSLTVAPGANLQARGHTADDRAETLLLRLLRGSGPRGLAVLPPQAPPSVPGSPDLVRPLIAARRQDVLAHLHRHALPFCNDPSNLDPRFARVRVRHELLPLLEELSPAIVDHLSALADMLASPGPEGLAPRPSGPASGGLEALGRAQRLAVERARRLGRRSLRLRLPGGRDVDVTFPGGRIVLTEAG